MYYCFYYFDEICHSFLFVSLHDFFVWYLRGIDQQRDCEYSWKEREKLNKILRCDCVL